MHKEYDNNKIYKYYICHEGLPIPNISMKFAIECVRITSSHTGIQQVEEQSEGTGVGITSSHTGTQQVEEQSEDTGRG